MSFQASRTQVIVCSLIPSWDQALESLLGRLLTTVTDHGQMADGRRMEIADVLNKALVAPGVTPVDRKISLILLLTPDLSILRGTEKLLKCLNSHVSLIDLARIDWSLLSYDQREVAYNLLTQVDLDRTSDSSEMILRLALELDEWINKSAKPVQLRGLGKSATKKAEAVWGNS